jgi:hypothetical protein
VPQTPTLPSADSPDQLEVLACLPGHYVLARWHNLTIVYWMQGATGPIVQRIQAATAQMSKAYPGGFSAIHLIRDGAPLPDADARRGFSAIIEEFSQRMACIGIVLMGAGFWASALQSVVTGMGMVTRRAFIMRFARAPEELCTWLPAEHRKRTGRVIDPAALSAAMAQLAAIGARSAREPEMMAI